MQGEPWPRLENISPCTIWQTEWSGTDWHHGSIEDPSGLEILSKGKDFFVGICWILVQVKACKSTQGLVKVWMILETYISHLKLSQVLIDQAIRCYKQLGFSARNVGPRFAQRLRSHRWMGPDFRDPWRKRICIPLILNDLHVLFFIWPSVSFSKSNESHVGIGWTSVVLRFGKGQPKKNMTFLQKTWMTMARYDQRPAGSHQHWGHHRQVTGWIGEWYARVSRLGINFCRSKRPVVLQVHRFGWKLAKRETLQKSKISMLRLDWDDQ